MWQLIIFSFLSKNVQDRYKTRKECTSFPDCLTLSFCDFIGDLLPQWACFTLHSRKTFFLIRHIANTSVRTCMPACWLFSIVVTSSLMWAEKLPTLWTWFRYMTKCKPERTVCSCDITYSWHQIRRIFLSQEWENKINPTNQPWLSPFSPPAASIRDDMKFTWNVHVHYFVNMCIYIIYIYYVHCIYFKFVLFHISYTCHTYNIDFKYSTLTRSFVYSYHKDVECDKMTKIKVCLWNTDYAPGGIKVQKSYI